MSTILLLIAVLAAANVDSSDSYFCDRNLDLLISLDGYPTVCNGNEPCPKWEAILKFYKDVVNSLTIGKDFTRVACITFSDRTYLEWGLLSYSDESLVDGAIDNVKYAGREFEDLPSVLKVLGDVFDPQNGDRKGVQNILIKITDGAPHYPDEDYAGVADQAHANGIAVFVVCERPGCTEHHAQAMASPPKQVNETYFFIDDYLQIEDVRDILVKKVCEYKEKDVGQYPG